jgi:hypothetical protein
MFDVPCQGGNERVEFDDGRADDLGPTEQPWKRTRIG